MRVLAEFIMRGRLQASLVAFLGNLVPLVSPATVGLVTLRHSLLEGCLVLLWASLPVVAMFYWSDMSVLLAATSVVGMVAVVAAAEALRQTLSWSLALMVALLASAALMVLVSMLASGSMDTLLVDLQRVLEAMKAKTPGPESVFYLLIAGTAIGLGLEQVSSTFVLGFLSWLTVMHVVVSLILARWWQAMLYNPGGFRSEFHGLRLDRVVACGLVAAILGCNLVAADYSTWASLLGVPLLLSGLGFVHYAVQFWQLGVQWLVIVYIGLLVFGPLSMVLIGIGFLDSFFDFRVQLAARKRK